MERFGEAEGLKGSCLEIKIDPVQVNLYNDITFTTGGVGISPDDAKIGI